MKKIITVFTMLGVMLVAGLALASNGSLLDMEETFVTNFWDKGNYKLVEPLLSDTIKADF